MLVYGHQKPAGIACILNGAHRIGNNILSCHFSGHLVHLLKAHCWGPCTEALAAEEDVVSSNKTLLAPAHLAFVAPIGGLFNELFSLLRHYSTTTTLKRSFINETASSFCTFCFEGIFFFCANLRAILTPFFSMTTLTSIP